jgi:uncharacterized phage protein (TIGR02218 family)
MSELLHVFTLNGGNWYYTSDLTAIVYGGNTYATVPFKREDMTFDFSTGTLSLAMPLEIQPFKRIRQYNPAQIVYVEIYQYIASPGTPQRLFYGKVIGQVTDIDTQETKVKMTSYQSLIAGKIPCDTFGPACNNNLGNLKCGVVLNNYRVAQYFSDLTIVGNSITATYLDSFADGYFAYGWVEIYDQKVMIVDHVGATVKTLFNIDVSGVTIGPTQVCYFYAGCDKSIDTCTTKFSNSVNFGGCPLVPYKNIFVDGWK